MDPTDDRRGGTLEWSVRRNVGNQTHHLDGITPESLGRSALHHQRSRPDQEDPFGALGHAVRSGEERTPGHLSFHAYSAMLKRCSCQIPFNTKTVRDKRLHTRGG